MTAAPMPQPTRAAGKSPAAFRTIAEVATELTIPAHVLRFWESKFPQLRPLKRRGGRRYYRPEDVALLRRIRSLLYAEGYTIKGVQRLLREGSRSAGEASAVPSAPDAESEPTTGAGAATAAADAGARPVAAPTAAAAATTGAHDSGRESATVTIDRDLLEAILYELQALRDALRGE